MKHSKEQNDGSHTSLRFITQNQKINDAFVVVTMQDVENAVRTAN